MNPLEQIISYKFRNPLLLAEALSHPSVAYETGKKHFDYQRLEFLGDAVLQLIITEQLYAAFPGMPEGRLTKLRTRLVSRDAIAAHALRLQLGEHLLMGRGEEMSGGRTRPGNLGDCFESLVGAIYLDSGMDAARTFVLRETAGHFEEVHSQPVEVNPKGQLQELLQSLSNAGPNYYVVAEEGPEHDKNFVSVVMWDSVELGRGNGRSKKASEIEAAKDALRLQKWK
ncbi:MAG: ribonuclease III [Verrucomicrobiales bacterium]